MCSATIAGVPSDYDIYALAILRYVAEGSKPTRTTPDSSDWRDSVNNETECADFPDSRIVPYESEDAPTDIFDTAILVCGVWMRILGGTPIHSLPRVELCCRYHHSRW